MSIKFCLGSRSNILRLFLFLFFTALIGLGCPSSDSVDAPAEVIDISGTWRQTTSGDAGAPPMDTFVFMQNGNNITQYFKCGAPMPIPVPCDYTVDGHNISLTCGTFISSNGTINSDQNLITGTMTDQYGTGTYTLTKLSDSTDIVSNGSVIINGDFCGNPVDINSDIVCAYKDLDNGSLNGLEIYTSYNGDAFGIDIESPVMSDTTYDIMADGFVIELQGNAVGSCYSDDNEKPASSGTVSIDVYDGTLLQGSFDLTFQGGYTLTGSFDVTL